MSTYQSPADPAAGTLARSTSVNNVDAATAEAFGLLPTNARMNTDTVTYAVDSGAANAYVVTLPQTAGAYSDGMAVVLKPAYSCTGASTINVDGLGLKTIKTAAGDDVAAGNIIAGTPVEIRYSSTTGYFHIIGQAGVAGPAGSLSGTAIGPVNLLTGAGIASASTVNLNTRTGDRVHITGTVAITAVTLTRGPVTVIFDGALTLTHHATNNNLPSAANITTAAGDRAIYEGDGTTVYCVGYTRANGTAVAIPAASQAQVEAITSNATTLTPANANWHPGVAKAWIKCDVAGVIQASHNITSITDDGTGLVTVTIGTDFSSADYAIVCGTLINNRYLANVRAQTAGSFQLGCFDPTSGTLIDPTNYYAVCYGDQA